MQRIRERKGKAASVFYLKEKLLGSKKKDSEAPTVVLNPKNNELVFQLKEIIRVSAEYLKDLLTNRDPKEEYREDVELKRQVHQVRMNETVENDIEFSTEMFEETFKLLKKKGGSKFDLILKARKSRHTALHKLYEVVWTQEKKPDSWRDTVVIQFWKG